VSVLVYVDDMLVAVSTLEAVECVKRKVEAPSSLMQSAPRSRFCRNKSAASWCTSAAPSSLMRLPPRFKHCSDESAARWDPIAATLSVVSI
jgi:hypothetical protein